MVGTFAEFAPESYLTVDAFRYLLLLYERIFRKQNNRLFELENIYPPLVIYVKLYNVSQ